MSDQIDNAEQGTSISDNEQDEGSSMEVDYGLEDQETRQAVSSADQSSSDATNPDLRETSMNVGQKDAQGIILPEIAAAPAAAHSADVRTADPSEFSSLGARPKIPQPKQPKKPKKQKKDNMEKYLDEMEEAMDAAYPDLDFLKDLQSEYLEQERILVPERAFGPSSPEMFYLTQGWNSKDELPSPFLVKKTRIKKPAYRIPNKDDSAFDSFKTESVEPESAPGDIRMSFVEQIKPGDTDSLSSETEPSDYIPASLVLSSSDQKSTPSQSSDHVLMSPRHVVQFPFPPEEDGGPLHAREERKSSLSNEGMDEEAAAAGLARASEMRRPMPADEKEYEIWLYQMRNIFRRMSYVLNDAYTNAWRASRQNNIRDDDLLRIFRYMCTGQDEGIEIEGDDILIVQIQHLINRFGLMALNMVYIGILEEVKFPDDPVSSSVTSYRESLSPSIADMFPDSRSSTEGSDSVFEHSENGRAVAGNLQLPVAVARGFEDSESGKLADDQNLQQPRPLFPLSNTPEESNSSSMSGLLQQDPHTENESEQQSNHDSNLSSSLANIESLMLDETSSTNDPRVEESSDGAESHAKQQTTLPNIESTSQLKESSESSQISKLESITSQLSEATHSDEKGTLTTQISESPMPSEAMEEDLGSRENFGSISVEEQSRTPDPTISYCTETDSISVHDKCSCILSIFQKLVRLLVCHCKTSSESSGPGDRSKYRALADDKSKAAKNDPSSESGTSGTSSLKRPSESTDDESKRKSQKTA